jgi:hypothetical protein
VRGKKVDTHAAFDGHGQAEAALFQYRVFAEQKN